MDVVKCFLLKCFFTHLCHIHCEISLVAFHHLPKWHSIGLHSMFALPKCWVSPTLWLSMAQVSDNL